VDSSGSMIAFWSLAQNLVPGTTYQQNIFILQVQ
jgi:hypothetical protein